MVVIVSSLLRSVRCSVPALAPDLSGSATGRVRSEDVSARALFVALIATASACTVTLLGAADGPASSLDHHSAVATTAIGAPPIDDPEPATGPEPAPSTPLDGSTPDTPNTTDTTLPGDDGSDEAPSDTVPDDADDATPTSTRVEPTVRTTDIAPASIVLALVVLVAVLVAWRVLANRSERAATATEPRAAAPAPTSQPATTMVPTQSPDTITLGFLLELGEALVDAGDAVHHVTRTLEGVARVNGREGLGAIVLPTALILTIPGADVETTKVATAGTSRLRLDQIESLMDLVEPSRNAASSPPSTAATSCGRSGLGRIPRRRPCSWWVRQRRQLALRSYCAAAHRKCCWRPCSGRWSE